MPRPRSNPNKFLISDMHIGTTMWQAATLESIGVSVFANTLSRHAHYAPVGALRQNSLLENLSSLDADEIKDQFENDCDLRDAKTALCSFPPARFLDFIKLPSSINIWINIAHRIHIHVPGFELIEYTDKFRKLGKDKRFKIATMSEYDFHYTRYYTGLMPVRLPVIASHVPKTLRERQYYPRNDVVLVGPSHNTDKVIGFDSIDELNELSKKFARVLGCRPYRFAFIRSVYP